MWQRRPTVPSGMLKLLDQCVAFHYGKVLTYDNALEVLGAVDSGVFSQMFGAIVEGRTKDCICSLEEIVIQGRELGQFVTDFIWYMRNLLLIQSADDAEGLVDMSEGEFKAAEKRNAGKTDGTTLMRYIRIFSDLSNQIRYATQKRVLVEIALIKLCRPAWRLIWILFWTDCVCWNSGWMNVRYSR